MAFAPTTVLKRLIEDQEVDLRLGKARTLDLLASKGRVRAADTTDLEWNVILSDSATATVPMTTAGSDQNTGDTIPAKLPIGAYKIYHQFSISRVELKDRAARGTKAIRQLFKMHLEAGIKSIRKQVNNYIWNADGSPSFGGFVGLSEVYDPTATYAGINPATYTNWIPIISANGGTGRALTKGLLRDMETLMDLEEVDYDCIVVHPTMSQNYAELWDVIAQEQAVVNNQVVDLATGGRSWANTPIVTDKYCPNTQMSFFDSNSVELLSFDLADSDRGQLNSLGMTDNFSAMTSAMVGGMMVNFAMIPPVNPGNITIQMFTLPQLKVANRRQVQAILDLTP